MTHQCSKLCFMCGRGLDVFKHIHLPCENAEGTAVENAPDIVICIPCLAIINNTLALPIAAYMQGGSVFDMYGRERQRRSQAQRGSQAPKWAIDALREIQEQQDG